VADWKPFSSVLRRSCCLLLALGASAGVLFAQGGLLSGLTRLKEGRSVRATSTTRIGPKGRYDVRCNWDNSNVAPGSKRVLLEAQGPGVVTHIWLTFLGPEPHRWAPKGSADHQEMVLRIFYDGRSEPGVEAPVGDFFANCFGKRSEVKSIPVVVEDGDSYNCFWPMPFRRSIRIEIENQSTKPVSLLYYNIDWIKKKSLPPDTPYFYARYRQEYPARKGSDYLVLHTKGKGHYVGTVLAVRTRSPAWFGEGDEKIYIDGEKEPSIWGTGTEDYFLSAWGLKTCSTPYSGTPYFDGWGLLGGKTSAYRWHINDPILFDKEIKVTFEHFGWISPDETPDYRATSWNEREDDYASVAFWYQIGEPTFKPRMPNAAGRKLPSLDEIFRAAPYTDPKHHGVGTAVVQRIFDYPEGQVLYIPASPQEAWFSMPFEVRRKKPVRLVLNVTKSYDFGLYQAFLNDFKIGPVLDFYSPTPRNSEFHLLDFWPDPGTYTLKLVCVGKAPLSQGYRLGIESVRLRRRRPCVEKYAHDRNKDWRKNPILYR